MDYINSHTCVEQLGELEKEYIQARNMISLGERLPLTNQLREALGNIAQEVQDALNDDDVSTADEAKKVLKTKQSGANKERDGYGYTLFYYSCLWLSDTKISH